MAGTLKDNLSQAHNSMVEALESMQESGADQETLQGMAQVLQNFRSFVEQSLGSAQQEPQAPLQQTASPEAGVAQTRPALQ